MKDAEALMGIAGSDVSVRALRPFLFALRSAGIDEAAVLRSARIEPTACDDDEARVELERARAFWAAVPAAAGDDRIGLRAGDYAQHELFCPLNEAGSRTLGSDAPSFPRRPALPGAEVELRIAGDRGAFRVRYRVAMPRVISDCWIAAGARFARDQAGGPWPLTEVHFAYPRPRDAAAYEAFFGLPVHFGQECDALVFPASMVDLRLRGNHATRPGVPLTARVARILKDQLTSGATDVARVAEQLAMSPRTLRRRLRAEGTHHGQLLDELRHEAAARYLAEGRAVSEVASLLGFAHPSTFSAAFKRWTGKAPRRAR